MWLRVYFAKHYLEGMCLLLFPRAESFHAKLGREINQEEIRLYDLENNGEYLTGLVVISFSLIYVYIMWSR
jgi:hypothetical protein